MSDDTRISEIKARLERATPGEWTAGNVGIVWAPDGKGRVHVASVGAFHDKELLPFSRKRWTADADLIANAPADIAHLLAEVESLEAALQAERQANGQEAVDHALRDEIVKQQAARIAALEGERDDLIAEVTRWISCVEDSDRERDAALARAEAADERTINGILQDLLDMPQDDPDHDDAIIVLYDHLLIVLERWVKYGGIEPALGEYRAALAAAAPGEGEGGDDRL